MKSIDNTRLIENNAARVNSLYYRYYQHLGYVPSPEEAEAEYVRLELNKAESKEGRQRRFKNAESWVKSVVSTETTGFNLQDWDKNKDTMIDIIEDHTDEQDRHWNKGKKQYPLSCDNLALVYYAILKSNEIDDQKKGPDGNKYAFSYHQVKDTFQATYQKGCHNDKIAAIFKILKDAELIERVGDFEVGVHGNQYEARQVELVDMNLDE